MKIPFLFLAACLLLPAVASAEGEDVPLYTFQHDYKILDSDGIPVEWITRGSNTKLPVAEQLQIMYLQVDVCMGGANTSASRKTDSAPVAAVKRTLSGR